MISVWLILIAVAVVVTICKFLFYKQITWKEYALILGVMVVIVPIIYLMAYNSDLNDREVLCGKVLSKEKVAVPCSHSYKCNPYWGTVHHTGYRTVNGKSRSYTYTTREQRWHTCYEHPRDYDWRVQTSFQTFDIERVDRQGCSEPMRWTQTVIGEPACDYHTYQNYIKAAQVNLFNKYEAVNDSLYTIPAYPSITDYWRMDKAFYVNGKSIQVPVEYSKGIGEINSRIGAMKQVNITMIVTNASQDKYPYAVSKRWKGLKKNDFIVLVGTSDFHKIDWVRALSWSKKDMVHVLVRDDLTKIGTLDSTTKILSAIDKDVRENYIRREMKDFEYLKSQVKIADGWWWFMGFVVIFGGITLIVCAIKYDWFGDEE